jgi:hypothetical protein
MLDEDAVPVDDIIETSNHFVAFDYLIDTVNDLLSNELIKKLHGILKTSTSNAQKAWFAAGNWKKLWQNHNIAYISSVKKLFSFARAWKSRIFIYLCGGERTLPNVALTLSVPPKQRSPYKWQLEKT